MEKTPEQDINPNELKRQLDQAIQYGTDEKVLSLFDNGMDIDQTDFQGRTALQLMAHRGKKDMVETLLTRGANVNSICMYQDRIPMTALDAAKEARRDEVVAILLEHGAKTGKELSDSDAKQSLQLDLSTE